MRPDERIALLERDIRHLRAETHGWAQFAVGADQKAGIAGELMTLIWHEIKATRAEVTRNTESLGGHTATLAEHGRILRGHTATLAEHGDTLAELREMIREILRRLP